MASSQEPQEYADAPQAILDLARSNAAVTVNLRPDHWTKDEQESFRSDRMRHIKAAMYHGIFMSRALTRYLFDVIAMSKVAICVQDTAGNVQIVVGTVREIYWLNGFENGKPSKLTCDELLSALYSIHASVRLEEDRDYKLTQIGQVWGNYILAIATVSETAPAMKLTADPCGQHFVQMVEQFGVRGEEAVGHP